MSWLFSQALVAAYSEANSLGGLPCAQLNVMPTPHPFWREDKTTDFSLPSQFGLTCAVLTADLGAALLTWFREAFLAKTSAPRAKELASKEHEADFGASLLGSLARWDRATSSWKTLQCSFLEGLESFSETWPRWGMMRDGACWALSMPAHLTSESESGLLPTPLASNTKAHHMRSGGRPARSYLPTPRSTDGDRGGRGDLIQAVRGNPNSHYKTWPTPHGFSKDGRSNGPSGNELGRAVNQSLWATPTVNGNYNAKGASAKSGDGLATQAGGSLNPTWVEWLMGWPLGWTDLKHSATDKFPLWLRSHGQF